jgi:tRNA A37 threonylcarbamoyladenosine biosynthesis protein TsaE
MKVRHPILGEGIVLKDRFSGSQLFVRFRSGITLWIRKEVLQEVERPKKLKVSPTKYGDFYQRKLIEAFKLGIVPYFGVYDFTFGRQKEIERITKLIDEYTQIGGGTIILEGEYGSGKTHLLDYLYRNLLEKGYAVSRVELDTFDVAPYRPKHIYREIIKTLELIKEDKEWNFRDIIKEAAINNIKLPEYHIFLSKALKLISTLKDTEKEEIFWKWIEGDYLSREYLDYCRFWRLPVLLDHAPACDIYAYILTGIGYILKKLGIKGFIVMLDEAETLFHLFYRERELSFYLYKGLISIANNFPQATTFQLVDDTTSDYLGVGKLDKSGMLHSAVRPTPYIYQLPSNIILILSLTPSVSSYYKKLISLVRKDAVIYLDKLKKDAVKAMYDKLVDIYQKAYALSIPDTIKTEIFKRLDDAHIRQFIRCGVEILDIYRHYK